MPAGADPDLVLRLAKAVADLYGDAHARLLATVARRLASGITEPGWAEAKLLEMSRLSLEARKIVDELTAQAPSLIARTLDDAFKIGVRQGAAELAEAGVSGVLRPTVNRFAVDALARDLIGQVTGTHGQILRGTFDVYRTVTAETSVPGVVTGSETRLAAAQRSIDRFADRGITGFVDRAGRRWQLDSYAEMATRTGVGRAQVSGTLERFAQSGRDLVIVSDAPQECKACRPWEGKVLSVSGTDPRYPSLDQAKADGLLHANCRHRLGAYIEGDTKRFAHTADPEGDRNRQRQRELERQVRAWKRREAVALDDVARQRAAAKVRERQAVLRDHVKANDLKRQPHRERI